MSDIYHAPPQASAGVAGATAPEYGEVRDGRGWVALAGVMLSALVAIDVLVIYALAVHGGRRS
jgi:hypothetical protein